VIQKLGISQSWRSRVWLIEAALIQEIRAMESSQNVGMPAKRKHNFWIAFGISLSLSSNRALGTFLVVP